MNNLNYDLEKQRQRQSEQDNKFYFITEEIAPRFLVYIVISFFLFVILLFLDFTFLFLLDIFFGIKIPFTNYSFLLGFLIPNIIFFNLLVKKKTKEFIYKMPRDSNEYNFKNFADVLLYNGFVYEIKTGIWHDVAFKRKRKRDCSLKVKINKNGISDFVEQIGRAHV